MENKVYNISYRVEFLNTITAIIVTYNRKVELYRCIQNVLAQSVKITSLLIIDNASIDNTYEYLYQNLYNITNGNISNRFINKLTVLSEINGIEIYYQKSEKNTGGSGGFYTGLKMAHTQIGSDYYWLMDDDGYPSLNCLEKLLTYSKQNDYVIPISINIDKHDELSWATRMKNKKKTIYYKELKESWGDTMDYVTPFNGSLLSNRCVSIVGYINKDFFIWGDEYEHYWRCKKNNFNPITVMDAVFYHPSQKLPLVSIFFGLFKVPFVNSPLRMICLARNYTYIYLHYDKKIKIFIKFLMYSWLFLITRKFDIDGYKLYLLSVGDAFKNDFTRHLKYI